MDAYAILNSLYNDDKIINNNNSISHSLIMQSNDKLKSNSLN